MHDLELLQDEYECLSYISDYIDKNIKSVVFCDKALVELKKISDFMNSIKKYISKDIITNLVKENKKIRNILEIVLENGLIESSNAQMKKLMDDSIIARLIEEFNDMQIKELMDFDINSPYISDSLRTYIKELYNIKLLSKEEEKELYQRIVQGDEKAKNEFVERNLRLVVPIAKKFMGRGVEFLDIVQEGNIALMKAVDGYDPEKGFKFSTYAFWTIFYLIKKSFSDAKLIRMPVYMHENIERYNATRPLLEKKFKREPTVQEIATELNLSEDEIMAIIKAQHDIISLNVKVTEEFDTELGDFLPSDDPLPHDVVISRDLSKEVKQLLKRCNLSPNELTVITHKFGLDGNPSRTLESISRELHISQERVGQIRDNALRKIRESKDIKKFAIYMDNPEQCLVDLKSRKEKTPIDIFASLFNKTINRDGNFNGLTKKEKAVIYLRVTNKDDDYYTASEIAKRLKIEEQEVEEITDKILFNNSDEANFDLSYNANLPKQQKKKVKQQTF